MKQYIMAIDEGTTGVTVMLFNQKGRPESSVNLEFTQYYPRPGWVEHSPDEIWETTLKCIKRALSQSKIKGSQISCIGITNQRETTVLWDKETSKPVYNAIVWQCRRTAPLCDKLKKEGLEETIKSKTGLYIDPYFSATKIAWILNKVTGVRRRAEKGKVLFGTMDTFLVWKLTGGKTYVTDYSNASRTMLFNINSLTFDQEILKVLNIPEQILPKVCPSSAIYGYTSDLGVLPAGIPISGIAGDQQAALFGQCCYKPGLVKNTYGTGCFLLMNTGEKLVRSKSGLLTTIAWGINNKVEYALEGSIFISGAVIQWLRDGLKIIKSAADTEKIANKVADNNGVYFVPAFVGIGAPYWDMYARGTILGLTRGTTREHIVRSALESIAYQTKDVTSSMVKDSKLPLKELRVDGGASANNFLMQFQADILQVVVRRPRIFETTALGAAYLAGLATGIFKNVQEISKLWEEDRKFFPQKSKQDSQKLYRQWKKAVERSRGWLKFS